MMQLIKSEQRALSELAWLKSYHSFSFAEHYDPHNKGWGMLRVINEDYVAPLSGFDMHYHRDMEILTYMLEGALDHKDSAGNEYTIHAGELQRISAGSGIMHSEYNSSKTQQAKLLQIWIRPDKKQCEPNYFQTAFDETKKHNSLALIASKSGQDGSVPIRQSMDIYASILDDNKELYYTSKNTKSWLQLIDGSLELKLEEAAAAEDSSWILSAGDAIACDQVSTKLQLKALAPKTHFLLFD